MDGREKRESRKKGVIVKVKKERNRARLGDYIQNLKVFFFF